MWGCPDSHNSFFILKGLVGVRMRELENLKTLISTANKEELIEVLMNQESNFSKKLYQQNYNY
jgi:hypothetical protein